MSPNVKVIHVTPHLNGGLGAVLKKHFECNNSEHYVYLFEKNLEDYPDIASEYRNRILDHKQISFSDIVNEFKIVQVEYWNHPLIYELIQSGRLDNARCLIGCAHIQGEHPPQLISENVINYFDKTLCTGTWLSGKVVDKKIVDKTSFIRYPIDTEKFSPISPIQNKQDRSRLRACYVGTVSLSKMSRDFFEIAKACQDFLDFTVVGEPDNEILTNPDFHSSNILFKGYCKDVLTQLRDSDIFVYPLRRGHYGTGELAIAEAMSCGLPVVAYNNESERSLIRNNQDGILCSSKKDFIDSLNLLALNKDLREKLGRSSRNRALELYSFSNFDLSLRNFYDSLIPKVNPRYYHIYKREILEEIDTAGRAFIQSLQGFNSISNSIVSSIVSCMTPLANDTSK